MELMGLRQRGNESEMTSEKRSCVQKERKTVKKKKKEGTKEKGARNQKK